MPRLDYADLDSRFGAFILDWHIRIGPFALWGLYILFQLAPQYLDLIREAIRTRHSDFSTLWSSAAVLVDSPMMIWTGCATAAFYFLYHPVFELLMHGNTPGKRWMHIKVVSLDGSEPTSGQILHRNFWRALEFLPFAYLWGVLAIKRSPEHARHGDIAARTRVVRD